MEIIELKPNLGKCSVYSDVFIKAANPVEVYDSAGQRLPFNRVKTGGTTDIGALKQAVAVEHDSVFWLYDDWDTNFGHFLMDTAPGLLQFRALPHLKILHSERSYAGELVAIYHPPALHETFARDQRVHHVRKLVRPEALHWHGATPSSTVAKFFNEVRDRVTPKATGQRYIMLTRRDSKRRPLENEAELIALVERAGFTPYEFGPLPLAERISIIRQARCVFSHCGAGACNYAWLEPNTTTVTLYYPLLHGEEKNNSALTRTMKGTPYALNEHGELFSNEPNIGTDYTQPWRLESPKKIADRVLKLTITPGF